MHRIGAPSCYCDDLVQLDRVFAPEQITYPGQSCLMDDPAKMQKYQHGWKKKPPQYKSSDSRDSPKSFKPWKT
jgi:hypothetical protein